MRNVTVILSLLMFVPLSWSLEPRQFEFNYEVDVPQLPADNALDLYLPLPSAQHGQRIVSESLQSTLPGSKTVADAYGNRFFHIHRAQGDNTPVQANLSWRIVREEVQADGVATLSAEDRARYLSPNSLVPVGHEILDPIRQEVHAMRKDQFSDATARAIYDWLVDNVEYKKVGTGWGNGDTFWACNERYGNCTDFHALFISLARTEGIPARFEIGFPVPLDRTQGDIGGYHCWVQFFLPDQGWVPIDASEAAKHPQMRELLFGSHPADRIHFTTGRDLVVSEYSAASPLNYFIYPYLEVGGKVWEEKIPTRFSYRDVVES